MGVTSAVYEIDPDRPDEGALRAAALAVEAGGLVILPTETVYGLAARPDLPRATARLFEAKGRPGSLNLPVLAPSASAAWDLAVPIAPARRLASAFWPGPLTLVLPRTDRSRPWALGERASIAVRVPDHRLTEALLRRTGPLAATSANRSGRPPLERPDDLVRTFADRVAVFLVLAPGSTPPTGVPSTVVDCTDPRIRVARRGALDEEAIRRALLRKPSEGE